MSVKKSWDIAPNRPKPKAAPQPAQTSSARSTGPMDMKRRAAPEKAKAAPRVPVRKEAYSDTRMPRPKGSAKVERATKETAQPLKKRRQKRRKVWLILLVVLALLVIGGIFYALWLPAFRIQQVRGEGAYGDEAASIARVQTYGSYLYILPRNSIFLLPETDIRESIVREIPAIQTVSTSADGLNTLVIETVSRTRAFVWCGTSFDTKVEPCWQADTEGLIFAPVDTAGPADLMVYATAEATNEGLQYPLGARVSKATELPDILRFVKLVKSLNANVTSVAFRDDEIDLYTVGGTRITYVGGREDVAGSLAASAFPTLNLNDGSVEYVDLRFEGKAYLKRKDIVKGAEE
ncbi:MAG: hypothetical protein JWN64_285 [Parcubacteria group bacterium]|nr:hypothetical protein [Parcubacteria group bacterium]